MDEERLSWLKEKAKHPKALAVGEIGLDYWDTPDRDIQKKWFIRQIELAKGWQADCYSQQGCGQ